MKLSKTFGSLTTLSLVVLYNSINAPASYAAQLGLGDSLEEEMKLEENTILSDSACGEEPISPEALQQPSSPLSQSLGPNLIASAATTDSAVGIQQPSPPLVAQAGLLEECAVGGIAPAGGLPAAAAGFPLAAALIPAGAAAAAIPLIAGGDDGNPNPNTAPNPAPAPPVPEPAETATAGLFACLGIAGVAAKRKINRSR